jgi:guanyl-specific ribonuclease Sa
MTESLTRIQKETQRLKDRKKRLAVDQAAESATTPKSTPPSSSSKRQESRRPDPSSKDLPTAASLVIEASTGGYFEDPVPANQMSSHLKSEHEAFKARCVLSFHPILCGKKRRQ